VSDSARQVRLGIKKVLSFEQEAILPARCMFRIKNGVLELRVVSMIPKYIFRSSDLGIFGLALSRLIRAFEL
jgi:hypothetical protein